MKYKFPIIRHIDQIRAAVGESREFIIVDKVDYIVVNYVIASKDTFPPVIGEDEAAAIRRECRGLIFYPNGEVMSRPYHKFFNVGERDETSPSELDMNASHVVLQKLDGSMIRPLFVNGLVRWATKMGITDVANLAEQYVRNNPHYKELALHCQQRDLTPMFEYCSRDNRIVIDYPLPRLVLTAVRHLFSGEYLKYEDMMALAGDFNIDVVAARQSQSTDIDLEVFLCGVRAEGEEDNNEGYVLRFQTSGHMVKVKTEWYVGLHRGRSAVESEGMVLTLIVEEKLDDIKGTLSVADRSKLEEYESAVINGLRVSQEYLYQQYTALKDLSARDFSLGPGQRMDKHFKRLMYSLLDSEDVTPELCWKLLIKTVSMHLASAKRVAEVRHLWGGKEWRLYSTISVEDELLPS
jgi:RNA ligase